MSRREGKKNIFCITVLVWICRTFKINEIGIVPASVVETFRWKKSKRKYYSNDSALYFDWGVNFIEVFKMVKTQWNVQDLFSVCNLP